MWNTLSNACKTAGNGMAAVVIAITLAMIWFFTTLSIMDSQARQSSNAISQVQHHYLVQGAFNETLTIAQSMIAQGETPENTLFHHSLGKGGVSGQYERQNNNQVLLTASAKDENGQNVLTAKALLAQLPSDFLTSRPIIAVDAKETLERFRSKDWDIVYQVAPFLNTSLPNNCYVSGSLAVLTPSGFGSVSANGLTADTFYSDGDLLLNGQLSANHLIVTGDLWLENAILECGQIELYGDLVINGQSQLIGAINMTENGQIITDSQPPEPLRELLPLTTETVLVLKNIN